MSHPGSTGDNDVLQQHCAFPVDVSDSEESAGTMGGNRVNWTCLVKQVVDEATSNGGVVYPEIEDMLFQHDFTDEDLEELVTCCDEERITRCLRNILAAAIQGGLDDNVVVGSGELHATGVCASLVNVWGSEALKIVYGDGMERDVGMQKLNDIVYEKLMDQMVGEYCE